ncbi:BID domain-containing T4SS effector [Bartonella kosoyi]|uniref:BID domain-containing T4SS effector n=1 Tax=Bartonella kosoyi TaxID=2133959 RepID=A0A5B9CYM7_9HYPH|nr:BID domain-containing T4SS effector [Bartonella kosoyi]QEE09704.1 BID domain-containing T4SS effector [Bartonella kosoyi]
MKKHQPHPSANPEAVYAQVNKPNRGNQRRPSPEEEVLYATVNTVDPLSRGGRHNQKQQGPETDYTEVAPSRREEEVTYASVSSINPLSRGGRQHQKKEGPETDYTEVSPQQRGRSSLTTEQITVQLLKNPQVQAHVEEVVYWSNIVYGKDNLFQQHLQDILTDPSKGKALSDQLAENPESIHKLAGRHALGMKSQARKQAEDGFRHLVGAIDGYTKAVGETKERLLQTPQAEQRRQQEHTQKGESHHHHHRHHHTRGQEQNSPEHSPRQQKHGMAYAM